jgi:hypothetical protein
MSDEKPTGPFTLTRQRVLLLVLGAVALLFILGSLMGGLSNYQELREAASSAAESPSSSAP